MFHLASSNCAGSDGCGDGDENETSMSLWGLSWKVFTGAGKIWGGGNGDDGNGNGEERHSPYSTSNLLLQREDSGHVGEWDSSHDNTQKYGWEDQTSTLRA